MSKKQLLSINAALFVHSFSDTELPHTNSVGEHMLTINYQNNRVAYTNERGETQWLDNVTLLAPANYVGRGRPVIADESTSAEVKSGNVVTFMDMLDHLYWHAVEVRMPYNAPTRSEEDPEPVVRPLPPGLTGLSARGRTKVFSAIDELGQLPPALEVHTASLLLDHQNEGLKYVNDEGEIVSALLGSAFDATAYAGYGVALNDIAGVTIPPHVKSGNVVTIDDVCQHIYFLSRDKAEVVVGPSATLVLDSYYKDPGRNEIVAKITGTNLKAGSVLELVSKPDAGSATMTRYPVDANGTYIIRIEYDGTYDAALETGLTAKYVYVNDGDEDVTVTAELEFADVTEEYLDEMEFRVMGYEEVNEGYICWIRWRNINEAVPLQVDYVGDWETAVMPITLTANEALFSQCYPILIPASEGDVATDWAKHVLITGELKGTVPRTINSKFALPLNDMNFGITHARDNGQNQLQVQIVVNNVQTENSTPVQIELTSDTGEVKSYTMVPEFPYNERWIFVIMDSFDAGKAKTIKVTAEGYNAKQSVDYMEVTHDWGEVISVLPPGPGPAPGPQ